MGLQIWLPMNGNLNNQGILNTTITSSGAIANANGKIGSCMKITSQTDSGYIPNFNTTGLTMGGWFKFNKSEISSVASGLSYSSSANSATGNVLGNTSYGGIGLVWNSNNYYTSNEFNTLYVFATIRTSTVFVSTSSITIEFDKWTHIMLIWNTNTRKLGLYKNGVLINEKDIGSFSDGVSRNLYLNYRAVYGGNGPSASIPMYCNDIRVYDNALTAEEVKKISQGLILHYPLSDGVGGENICKVWDVSLSGSDFGSYSTRTYDTTTHIGKIQVTNTSNKWNAWRFGTSDLDTPCTTLTTGTNTYTMSVDIKVTNYTSGTIRCDFDFRTNNVVSSLATAILTAEQCNGEWHRVSASLTTNNQQNTACLWCINSNNTIHGSQTTIEYKNWKLERGDKATPWIPNKSNSDYSKIGLNSNIAYDVSGYGHNGTKSDSFDYSSDTPRYNISTLFSGSNYITAQSLPVETKTISCWVKTTKNKSTSQIVVGDYNTKLCISFYNGTIISYFSGSGASTGSKCTLGSEYKENDWNHIVVVDTGSNTRDVYVNCVKLTPTTNDYWSASSGLTIGRRNNSSSPIAFYGYLSDFRAYATALSADDILELYKTPSYLASNAS